MLKTTTLLAALALAGGAHAQDFIPKAQGRVVLDLRVSQVAPQGDDPVTTLAGAASGLKAKVGKDVMPTIGVQYFFTDNVAVEVIAGTTQHTVRAQGPGVDIAVKETWVLPPVVTLQYHFAPSAKVSPYVGAGINYMLFYSGKDKNGFNFDVDNGFGTALQAGVDIALQGHWTLNADVKKVFFETDATDNKAGLKSKVTLDPVVLSVGLGYRF